MADPDRFAFGDVLTWMGRSDFNRTRGLKRLSTVDARPVFLVALLLLESDRKQSTRVFKALVGYVFVKKLLCSRCASVLPKGGVGFASNFTLVVID